MHTFASTTRRPFVHESKTRVRFTVYQPGLSPQQVTLPAENITLGRASDCTIPIKDRFLSRRHAEIIVDRGTWFVRDCGSVNGTTLNGVKLVETSLLHPGDRIGLGDSEVVFHSDETTSQFIAIDTDSHATNLAISVDDDDTEQNDKFARAQSIIAQRIRSAVCAPLLVADAVLGVLYIDYTSARGVVAEDDVRLLAQIARFAAVTLERTRLREEAFAKAKIDEELRTAYKIQQRLLPDALPEIEGYSFAGANRPCKTVSGDYYDVVVRPDGRIYFVIADVSGKGITAALVMSSVATAFAIFTRNDPTPADLLRDINETLAPKTSPSKFVTMVAGVLDPTTGIVSFANAGHVAPLVVSKDGVEAMHSTDIVVGILANAQYRNQSLTLAPGDSLVLFTDGVTEAENIAEEQLGLDPVCEMLRTMHGSNANAILKTIDTHVHEFIGEVPAGDDVTMLAMTRCAP